MIRVRPKHSPGKLSTYWPSGDIMNFWPTLLRRVLEQLLPDKRSRYLKTLLEHHNISDTVLFEAMNRYIQALKLAYQDPDIISLDVACAKTGFILSHPVAQAAIFMTIGEQTSGLYVAGLKDTTPFGENGIRDDVESLVWAAEQQAHALRG